MGAEAKKVYLPKSRVPASRGITGYKDRRGNVVIVDPDTGIPIEDQHDDKVTTSGRKKKVKPPKAAKPKAVVTSKPDNELENDGSGDMATDAGIIK